MFYLPHTHRRPPAVAVRDGKERTRCHSIPRRGQSFRFRAFSSHVEKKIIGRKKDSFLSQVKSVYHKVLRNQFSPGLPPSKISPVRCSKLFSQVSIACSLSLLSHVQNSAVRGWSWPSMYLCLRLHNIFEQKNYIFSRCFAGDQCDRTGGYHLRYASLRSLPSLSCVAYPNHVLV